MNFDLGQQVLNVPIYFRFIGRDNDGLPVVTELFKSRLRAIQLQAELYFERDQRTTTLQNSIEYVGNKYFEEVNGERQYFIAAEALRATEGEL